MEHINTVLGLFLMLIVGYGAKKLNLLKEEHSKILNDIILNITLPAFVISNLLGKELNKDMFTTPFVLYAVSSITIVLAVIIGKSLKFKPTLVYSIAMTASFANTGFLGYPLTEALFKGNPQALPTAVIVDQFGMQLILYTTAPLLASFLIKDTDQEKFSWKTIANIFKSPVLIVSILGLIFHKYTLPDCLTQTCGHLSGATVPLVMISIGLKIKPSETPKYVIPALIVIALKMILQPIMMYFGTNAIIEEKFIVDIATIQVGLSPAMVTSILIDKYNGDTHFACAAIFICTLLTILFVPITATLLGI